MKQKQLSIIGPEPVSLPEARRQCFVTKQTAEEDNLLTRLIAAARDYAEKEIWRAITPANYLAFADSFPAEIELPRPPAIEIDKIEYINPAGDLVELDSSEYRVDTISEPARIKPVGNWPQTHPDEYNAVQITFKAGYLKVIENYSDENNCPEAIKNAILMMVKHFYDNPEAVIVSGGGISVNEVPLGAIDLLNQESARIFA